ncbi:MAG: MCE family protein [Bacteroidetes bacterium]|nr:MCE family protein [Bacteroidota bacterium]
MAKNKTNYVKLGIFVTLAFIVFTYGVYRISDRKDFFRDTMELYVDFKDVNGLRAGNKVRFSGINVGNVSEVKIINDTTLRVFMELETSVGDYLQKNATAAISSDGLVGNMIVTLSPANGEAALVESGDKLTAKSKKEISEMLETLGSSNDNISLISQQLLQITEKMNQGDGSISLLLNDKALATNLAAATQSLQSAATQLDEATNEINVLVEQISDGEGNLGYLLRDTSLKTQVDALGANLDSLIAIRTIPVMENLVRSSESIAAASMEIENLLEGFEHSEGLAGLLLSDTASAQSLRSTLQNLNEGTRKFEENMEALEYNWLFRKYYKKKKKEDLKKIDKTSN